MQNAGRNVENASSRSIMQATSGDIIITAANPVAISSLLSNDESTIVSVTPNAFKSDNKTRETEMHKKFKEAFNMTQYNNLVILPGESKMINSIKKALFKVQKGREEWENEIRQQMYKAKLEGT